jgi:8-amino-7-oxononanoate synthase
MDRFLREALAGDEAQGLKRALECVPDGLVSFADNDYLGLRHHPAVREGLARGAAGSGAARLLGSGQKAFAALEDALADYKQAPRALVFSSGYLAAAGTIPALAGRGDVVILDKLAHACLLDGARLSDARRLVFPHNDLAYLEDMLKRLRSDPGTRNILVVVESLYSMDGDFAPLRELAELKDRHGAWLMVDEAHATGLFGPEGRGKCAEEGISGRVEVQMGTLGKGLGACGGFIAGSAPLVDFLVQRARTFLFDTALPPGVAEAAREAVRLARSPEGDGLRRKLRGNEARLGGTGGSPIVPVLFGEERAALDASARLAEQGFRVPAIRYPTVARGEARLRVSLSARHEDAQVEGLKRALQAVGGARR